MDNTIATLGGSLSQINTSPFDLKTLIELGGSLGTLLGAFFAS